MTTPGPTLEERVAILETRFDTILPTLATKEDIARLEGKIDASNQRLEGKINTMEHRLLLRFAGITATLLAIAVAAGRFL